MDAGQLADALHQIRHRGRKQLADLLMGGVGVLDGVVEQGRHDGLRVQVQLLRHDLGHGQRVGDERRAVLPVLSGVVGGGVLIGGADLVEAGGRVI